MANIKPTADFIHETSLVTGLNDIELDGAPAGFRKFSETYSDGDSRIPYGVYQQGSGYETGLGTFRTGPNRIERDQVISSSNGDAPVSWGGGTKIVVCSLGAAIAAQYAREILALATFPSPTINPNDGDVILVSSPATGLFATHENEWATWDDTGGAWTFEAPQVGDHTTLTNTNNSYKWTGTAWIWVGEKGTGRRLDDVGAQLGGDFNFGGSTPPAARISTAGGQLPTPDDSDGPHIAVDGFLQIKDTSSTTVAALPGSARIFVDQDGALKIRFGDGSLVTIVTNPA